MKNKTIKPIHDLDSSIPTRAQSNPALDHGGPPVRHVFQLGLDVDLKNIVTAIQCERGAIALAQKFSRARLLAWVQEKVAAGHAVHTVYEACGFGYTLHHQLVAAGAHSIVTTPMRLSPERRRKNDRLDARELCVRLSRRADLSQASSQVSRLSFARYVAIGSCKRRQSRAPCAIYEMVFTDLFRSCI